MKKEMLINVLQAEECRIAIVEDGVLEELYVERASQESYVGNIYKGKIVNIEPGIQAAFVDFGIGRNGFLHLSDVDPVYYKHLLPQDVQDQMDAEDAAEEARNDARSERVNRGDRRERDESRPVRVVELPSARAPAAPLNAGMSPSAAPVEMDDEEFGEVTAEPAQADDGEDDGFASDLLDDPAPSRSFMAPAAPKPAPPAPVRPAPVGLAPPAPPAPVPAVEEDAADDFGAGILDDDEPRAPVAKAKPTQPPTQPVVPPAEESKGAEDDFNAGWELVTPAVDPGTGATPEPQVESRAAAQIDAPPPDAGGATEELVELVAEVPEPAGKKPAKGRGKKAKADDAPAAEAPAEKPKKAPAKRATRKKSDDADEAGGARPMPSSERRTAPDDEPEVRPFFFGGGSDDFDVSAPNDRFAGATPPPVQYSKNYDPGEDRPAPTASEGRAFDEEFGPPKRSDDDRDRRGGRSGGRNDRGGGRGRSDRGGDRGERRGPPPSRDRGERSDRPERSGERSERPQPAGERVGGFERGPRPGGAGPGRGGPPPRDRGYPRPPIQEIFKRGQEVVVQVIKEAIGTKAPNLSTFISIAGRYLVLMPSLNRVGVSRKIEDVDARKRLRTIMTKLNPPKGVGFIVRTAATERNESELKNDLAYLLRLWEVVARRIQKVPAPVEIYRESDMITRTIRDNFTPDIETIIVDEETAFNHAAEFLQVVMPRFANRIKYYADTEPLFIKYRIDEEIAKINSKRVELPLGGSIIIEQTEALVAIDVNSGNFRADNNAEETAFQVNTIAAKEIARQLRLRDLGGVIVNDFIDMRSEAHRRKVEETLLTALKRDKARTKILRISQFGIIEMTRQRIQTSLKKRIFHECPHCKGSGHVKTNETMGIEVMRVLQLAAHRTPAVTSISVTVQSDVAFYLLNKKRQEIAALETRASMEVQVVGQLHATPDLLEVKCLDSNGNEVRLFQPAAPPARYGRQGAGR